MAPCNAIDAVTERSVITGNQLCSSVEPCGADAASVVARVAATASISSKHTDRWMSAAAIRFGAAVAQYAKPTATADGEGAALDGVIGATLRRIAVLSSPRKNGEVLYAIVVITRE
ncbi:unannotated protein [freshwater metagenome]|uniref:Unannotated protein n=1 Tax=freshwater metagenome TaxID=449393 RepID=A0A6J7FVT7_9ZZZZ